MINIYQIEGQIRNRAIAEAREAGAEVADDARVYALGDEDQGCYAVEDSWSYVYVELGGGVFVPADAESIEDAIYRLSAGARAGK